MSLINKVLEKTFTIKSKIQRVLSENKITINLIRTYLLRQYDESVHLQKENVICRNEDAESYGTVVFLRQIYPLR